MAIEVSICCLPEELSIEWDKQQLGDWMVAELATLLESENSWQCKSYFYLSNVGINSIPGNVPGLSDASLTLFTSCKASDMLVSLILQ